MPHLLYVEEAHNFIPDFESILSETRKYTLSMAIALAGHRADFPGGRAGRLHELRTLISFRVSAPDAARLQEEMVSGFLPVMLQDLADYRAYVRTLVCDAAAASRPTRRASRPSRPSGNAWRDGRRGAREQRALYQAARGTEARSRDFCNGRRNPEKNNGNQPPSAVPRW